MTQFRPSFFRATLGVALFLALILIGCSGPEAYYGAVLEITDGDSFVVTRRGEHLKIRLAEVDAPEPSQFGFEESKAKLDSLIRGYRVWIEVDSYDQYGRVVAHVYAGGAWVNGRMVEDGLAWVYQKYAKSPKAKELYRLEAQAKDQGIGVWSQSEAERTPPWVWRQRNRIRS